MHVVAHRQIASPDDAAVTLTRRTGKVEVIGIDEDRIAKIQSRPRDVAELERRIRLGEAELPDSHQPADSIGIGDAGEAEVRLRLRPPPRTREALTRSSDLVIGAVQLVPDGAVQFRSAQRIGRMPRQRQQKSGTTDDRRIDDDVLSEPALVALLLLDTGWKNPSEIPVAVLVLPEMHERMLGFEMT